MKKKEECRVPQQEMSIHEIRPQSVKCKFNPDEPHMIIVKKFYFFDDGKNKTPQSATAICPEHKHPFTINVTWTNPRCRTGGDKK